MIPYFQFNSIVLGLVVIQVWGLFVALGIVAGIFLSVYLARKFLLSPEALLDMSIWILIGSFIFARVFHVVFYSLDYYLVNPLDVFKFWQGGASSLGGFFGAAVALWLFSKKRLFTFKDLRPYFDIMTPGLWLGWGIGRIGCFMIHDHLGRLSDSFLAVNFPEGARFDLGLMDSILGFILFVISAILFKKFVKISWGLLTAVIFMLYAAARFFLDFLRATDISQSDARYANLTPAQWGLLFTFFILTFLLIYAKMRRVKVNRL